MDLKKYIFPIYSGGTIIGQCFIADGYLITAAHVVEDFPKCFTRINGKTFGFSGFYPDKHPIYIGEGNVHHDPTMIDVAIYQYDDINSPLKLTSNIPQEEDGFDSYSTYEVMDFTSLNPSCELKRVSAFARGIEEGNYFYCDCKQYGGSSGSPLIRGNQVIGIMHGGDGNGLCAFLRTDVVSMIISQKELSLDYDEWDLERAWEYEGCTYSKDKKRLLKGTDNTILQGTIVICNEAFCYYDYKGELHGLASGDLIIPSSVKIIGKRAFAWSRDLETVVIPDSVIQIGKELFYGCTFLRSVVLPESLIEITNGMFWGCQSLQDITIPSSVTRIGEGAFDGCEELEEFFIPNSVKRIEDWAFMDCKSLTSISLPNSIESMGKYVFGGCDSLEKIVVPFGTMEKYERLLPDYIDILVEEDPVSRSKWEPYDEAFSLKEIWDYEYPDDDKYGQIDGEVAVVVAIESEDGNQFLRIRIPFKNGSSEELKLSPLSELEEGDKVDVSTIVGQEFHKEGCNSIVRYSGELYFSTDVTEEDLANVWTDEYGVKYSADRKRLLKVSKELWEKENWEYNIIKGTKVICDEAFCLYENLYHDGHISITIPNSVIKIGHAAFKGISLSSIIIPSSVKVIVGNPFVCNKGLFSIKVEIRNTVYDSRNDCNAIIDTNNNILISGCSKTQIPDSIREIGNEAFKECLELTDIIIPDGIVNIGASSFSGCESLKSIIIPQSVNEIKDKAFEYCEFESIIIPDNVNILGDDVFSGCHLKRIYSSEEVKERIIKRSHEYEKYFDETVSTKYDFSNAYEDELGAKYSNDNRRLLSIPKKLKEYVVKDGTEYICNYAFVGGSRIGLLSAAVSKYKVNVVSVFLPNSIKGIGKYAFAGCKEIVNVFIPKGTISIFEVLLPDYKGLLVEK